MVVHKLNWDDFFDEQYILLAIHSTLEDYQLAYYINKMLGVNLKRSPKDLDLNYPTATKFPLFEYYMKGYDTQWNLLGNICKTTKSQSYPAGTLFKTPETVILTHYLLPEYKSVHYFLKLSNQITYIKLKHINKKLKLIAQLITSYAIDITKIKHKDRLIF